MPKPYDAVTKTLIDRHPADWLSLLGLPDTEAAPIEIEIVDSDLSTVTSQADRVLKISGSEPSLQHIELETGHHGADSPGQLLRYSVLVSGKYKLPVDSTIILLRREADSPALTGRLQYRGQRGTAYLSFEYTVIRVWEIPVNALLEGGLGTLPLAPLADMVPERLPEVIRRIRGRFAAEAATEAEEGEFLTTTNVLMGLRYSEARDIDLLQGVRQMKESVTYQAILQEGEAIGEARGEAIGEARGEAIGEARGEAIGEARGRAEEARSLILRLGRKRFGPPLETTIAFLEGIESVERLEQLADLLLEVETWDELLAPV